MRRCVTSGGAVSADAASLGSAEGGEPAPDHVYRHHPDRAVEKPAAERAEGLEARPPEVAREVERALDEALRGDPQERHEGADEQRQEDQLGDHGGGRAAQDPLHRLELRFAPPPA
jgi:hypothetical protein